MKIVVGLGNFGKEYQNTYHNLGFAAIDRAAEILDFKFSKEKCFASIAEGFSGCEKIVFAKPSTFMNLSGKSVSELVGFYKIDLKDLLVVYDDFDLDRGRIRIRESGSAGTHNGMKSIISELNSQEFPRVRIGFKPSGTCPIPLIDFVLSTIPKEEKELFDKATLKAAKAIVGFCEGESISSLTAKYNGNLD